MAIFDPFVNRNSAAMTLAPNERKDIDTRGIKALEIQVESSPATFLYYVSGHHSDDALPPNTNECQFLKEGEYRAFVAESCRAFSQGFTLIAGGTGVTVRLNAWK